MSLRTCMSKWRGYETVDGSHTSTVYNCCYIPLVVENRLMTQNKLHLFLDTNLFIQCKDLKDIDWSIWAGFDEVHLCICRTVLREIDKHKTRGNDRLGRRARHTSTLFGRLVSSTSGFLQIHDRDPRVTLQLDTSLRPSEELAEVLDYSKPDDEILGFTYGFQKTNQEADVRLLTDDNVAMATAKSIGLNFEPVKDEWRLPPENSGIERENARLKEEINRLKNAEPNFRLRCVGENGAEVTSLALEETVYEPLTEDEIGVFVNSLENRFPAATDFGSPEPAERELPGSANRLFGLKETYTPASEEAIDRYANRDYPGWIEECRQILGKLHETFHSLNGYPSFCFEATNSGNRPGEDVLVRIEAKGNFSIRPPVYFDEPEAVVERELTLPAPPRPPKGEWTSLNSLLKQFALNTGNNPYFLGDRLYDHALNESLLTSVESNRRDPNSFYYKPNKSELPVESFSLECELWRHRIEPQQIEGEICFDPDLNEISGALNCQIHASNVSVPVDLTVPLRIIVVRENVIDYARTLVNRVCTG